MMSQIILYSKVILNTYGHRGCAWAITSIDLTWLTVTTLTTSCGTLIY